jgi:hypothetical protein
MFWTKWHFYFDLGNWDTSDYNYYDNLISLFVFLLTKTKINDFGATSPGFKGFILNLTIFISALHYLRVKNKTPEIPNPGNPTA